MSGHYTNFTAACNPIVSANTIFDPSKMNESTLLGQRPFSIVGYLGFRSYGFSNQYDRDTALLGGGFPSLKSGTKENGFSRQNQQSRVRDQWEPSSSRASTVICPGE